MKKQKKTIKKALKQQNRKKQKRFYKNLTKQKGGSMKKQILTRKKGESMKKQHFIKKRRVKLSNLTKKLIKSGKFPKNRGKIPKNWEKLSYRGKLPKIRANHHDEFFKNFFCRISYAKQLLKLIFSKKELQKFWFDLKTLKVEQKISKSKRMDLVLSFYLKNIPNKQVKTLLIVEHKSRYDKKLYKQVLSYTTDLYMEADKPIVVIPAFFYHGKTPWRWKTRFQEGILGGFYSKIPAFLKKSLLDSEIKLIDTKDIKNKSLRVFLNKSSKMACVLKSLDKTWVLGHNKQELEKLLLDIFKVFKTERDFIAFARYFTLSGVSREAWRKTEKKAKSKGFITKGGYMDIRTIIRNEGRQEGRQEGWQKGLQKGLQEGLQKRNEVILNMLKNKLDISMISKVTGLSVKEIKKFKNGS